MHVIRGNKDASMGKGNVSYILSVKPSSHFADQKWKKCVRNAASHLYLEPICDLKTHIF